MEEELQTTATDAEVSTEAGQSDVSSELISQLNTIAGREFKDVEDFQKHYKNLSSMVGKKDEAGEKLNAILAKAKPYADAYGADPVEFLETYLENPNVTEDDLKSTLSQRQEQGKLNKTSDEINQIKQELALERFQRSHPDLVDQMKLIEVLAKGQNISLEEASKDPLVKKAVELTEKKSTTSIIQTNQRVASTDSDLARKRQAISSGTTDSLADYLSTIGVGKTE